MTNNDWVLAAMYGCALAAAIYVELRIMTAAMLWRQKKDREDDQ